MIKSSNQNIDSQNIVSPKWCLQKIIQTTYIGNLLNVCEYQFFSCLHNTVNTPSPIACCRHWCSRHLMILLSHFQAGQQCKTTINTAIMRAMLLLIMRYFSNLANCINPELLSVFLTSIFLFQERCTDRVSIWWSCYQAFRRVNNAWPQLTQP